MTQKRPRIALSDAAIYEMPDPGTRVAIRDRRISQLVLLVGQRSRTWYLHGTVKRRTHRVRLGRFPVLTVDQARDECLTVLRRLYAGKPAVEAPGTRAAPTLAKTLDEYITMRHLGTKATADLRSVIRVHAKAWADQPIDRLDASAVARYYRKLAEAHPGPANRLLAALSALTRFSAASQGGGDAALISKVKALLGGASTVKARDVVIPDDRQREWAAQVDRHPSGIARYLKALMLTGMRANELRCMPRAGWDETAGVIRVAHTKNGKPHALPVGPELRKLLKAETSEGDADAPLFNVAEDDYRAAVDAIGAAVGIAFHLHDLRRTFGTVAVRLGLDAFTVKRLMNHSAGSDVTAKHYVKLDVEDLRPAMKRIEAHVVGLWGNR
ncbi:MAG: integrase family protein [Proteobacteria bacterium]|nr:integrase family protein [Pseudomonadota bacterium]